MAKKVGAFLKELAQAAGVPTDQKHWDAIVAIDTEIPDEVSTELNSKILTRESAKHDSELRKILHAEALNGVDSMIDSILDENQADDAFRASLKGVSTSKRVKLVSEKIKELTEKKAAAKPGDRKEIQDEIDKLNKQIVADREAHAKALKAEQDKYESALDDFTIESELSGKNYAIDAPKNVNVMTAKNLLAADLKEKKLKAVRKDGKLTLIKDDGSDYYEQNKLVSFGDYADKLLGTHKLLKVSNPATPDPKSPNPNPIITPPKDQLNGKNFAEQAKAAKAAYESGSAVMV